VRILSRTAGVFCLMTACLPLNYSARATSRAPTYPVLIRYQTSVCYGRCPAYVVTVAGNGLANFDGHSATKIKGQKKFRVTRNQFLDFAEVLERHRFRKGGEPGMPACALMHTDDISVSVTWTMSDGKIHRLKHYFGCDSAEFTALEKDLIAAPKLLPIKAYVG
jgi:hypothetical protein